MNARDMRFKTPAYKDWEVSAFFQLQKHEIQENITTLREQFDANKHSYEVTFTAYYPRNTYFTKQGRISSKTMDLSNFEKPLLDLIFLPKYHNSFFPYGCPNLNVDDKLVSKLTSSKKSCDNLDITIEVQINIIPLIY